jgi:hypothetical protein
MKIFKPVLLGLLVMLSVSAAHATSAALCYSGSGGLYPSCSLFNVTQTIASGTAAMTTAAIASGACGSTVTVSAPSVATTDIVDIGNNGNPTGVTGYTPGGGLAIRAWPTSGNVNFCVSNEIGTSVTPGALTINWSVRR